MDDASPKTHHAGKSKVDVRRSGRPQGADLGVRVPLILFDDLSLLGTSSRSVKPVPGLDVGAFQVRARAGAADVCGRQLCRRSSYRNTCGYRRFRKSTWRHLRGGSVQLEELFRPPEMEAARQGPAASANPVTGTTSTRCRSGAGVLSSLT
eukprot:1188130-Prorocentrum_minimum.AAC.5